MDSFPGLYLSVRIHICVCVRASTYIYTYTREGGRVLNINERSRKFRWRLGAPSTPRDLSIRWIFERSCRNLGGPRRTSAKRSFKRNKHSIKKHD